MAKLCCCVGPPACLQQILTHMKAKLAFIESENKALTAEQKELDAALKGKRDELASLKGKRDRLWQQQRTLKEGSVFVTNPMLLQDMQVRVATVLDCASKQLCLVCQWDGQQCDQQDKCTTHVTEEGACGASCGARCSV